MHLKVKICWSGFLTRQISTNSFSSMIVLIICLDFLFLCGLPPFLSKFGSKIQLKSPPITLFCDSSPSINLKTSVKKWGHHDLDHKY